MNKAKAESTRHERNREVLLYIVDDEPMLLELASTILGSLGYQIATFRSPELALSAYEAADPKPALIISDFAMRNMTGLELTAACRRIRPEQKVLMVSGTVGVEIYESAPVRPNHLVFKPYQTKELIEAVETLLASQ
jgi:CheY-like chemotaxis protein